MQNYLGWIRTTDDALSPDRYSVPSVLQKRWTGAIYQTAKCFLFRLLKTFNIKRRRYAAWRPIVRLPLSTLFIAVVVCRQYIKWKYNIIIIITIVLYSAPSILPTQKRFQPMQPRSNVTVLRAKRKEMERSTGILAESDRKPIPGRRASMRRKQGMQHKLRGGWSWWLKKPLPSLPVDYLYNAVERLGCTPL